ncbi:unnamed protein product, partial [Aphanomyces euteiches]
YMLSLAKLVTLAGLATFVSAWGDVIDSQLESVCVSDQSQPAVAYKTSDPTKYKLGLATARLRIGSGICTGWLFGTEGHLMTNHHCISTNEEAASAITEFLAECATADDPNNSRQLACTGVFASNSSTLVYADKNLDFGLVKLNLNPGQTLDKYGSLQVRTSGAVLNEPIYTIGYPGGNPKKIALVSDDGNPPKITSVSSTGCYGTNNNVLGYNVDTQGGSSGSPIISAKDNLVIGLHDCGGCTSSGGANTGIRIEQVVDKLKSLNLLPQ